MEFVDKLGGYYQASMQRFVQKNGHCKVSVLWSLQPVEMMEQLSDKVLILLASGCTRHSSITGATAEGKKEGMPVKVELS